MTGKSFRRLGAALAVCLAAGGANAGILVDNSITGMITNDFEEFVMGNVPGFITQTGATYGERFAGQTLGTASGFDTLSGSPTGPLTLLAAASIDDNIGISCAIDTGCDIYGDRIGEVGEGALSVLLDRSTDVFGFTVVGANPNDFGGGFITAQFFRGDGSLIAAITQFATDTFFGFRATAGDRIRAVSLTNNDPYGLGYGSVTFSVRAAPEPTSIALLGLGLAGLAASRRRSR
jgi:hypothetical protein